jgi:UDP-N-acetylmuramyl tripeptide synthase
MVDEPNSGTGPAPDAEPNHGFDDSRRLTGANRYFDSPAVTLTPLGPYADDPRAHRLWAAHVRGMAAQLAWPDPEPRVIARGGTTLLVFRAPADLLFTATEVNEWAWESAASSLGETGFDLAQDLGADAAAIFAARVATEQRPELEALRIAAVAHDVLWIEDDATISLGAGEGSRCYPRAELPAPSEVPWAQVHDVPTVLVTGSNGKTTTSRLVAAMTTAAGFVAGLCCTEGVFIGGDVFLRGDYAGPEGARQVLRHPRVQAAILETARGGILRRGLAMQRADVAIVTNISADHLGEYGVQDAEDLAATKLVVAHAVRERGSLVLNADDGRLMAAAARLPAATAARPALFAADFDAPALVRLRAAGGSTSGARDGVLRLSHRGQDYSLGAVESLPLTVSGAAGYNLGNLAAAALAGMLLDLAWPAVQATVHRFGANPLDNPGRLERWAYRGAQVLIDYAHNPDGLAAVLQVARSLRPKRLLLLLGQAGNRDDAAIGELAATAAGFTPDLIVLKELPLMLRGRVLGEVPALLERALRAAGVAAERIELEADELAAAFALLDRSQPGDVVVLPIHTNLVRDPLRARLELVHTI